MLPLSTDKEIKMHGIGADDIKKGKRNVLVKLKKSERRREEMTRLHRDMKKMYIRMVW